MNRQRATPRLSVIIPTLDERQTIGDVLDDLAGLRDAGHEVILVDGGSSDATPRIAAPGVDKVLRSDRGRARQMNAGARAASGDVLWFLHADCRIPAGAAQQVIDGCARGPIWGRFDVRLSGAATLLRIVETLMNLRSRISGIATGDQGIFVSRALFDQVGGFPDIPLMEDIALSTALRRVRRPDCIRQPRLLASSRRWETHGILRTIVLMWRLRLAFALGTPATALARHYR
ncbi:MAG: TIGR04283 family arsenosugar biosynthesis glycosyltransferase [Gammaproteobacteria bacterium]|nr:TIGR04283 family arsenosugar biosynthesis glycosyltransferase [Gammaproteobacteria bacterium]